jgi:hypothetical protein
MSHWRVPYAALWTIAGAETLDDLVRLWTELDGPAELKAFFYRTRHFQQTPYGRPWHGERKVEKLPLRDPELREAIFQLIRRIVANPVFVDSPRGETIKDTIVTRLAEITGNDISKIIRRLPPWGHDRAHHRHQGGGNHGL